MTRHLRPVPDAPEAAPTPRRAYASTIAKADVEKAFAALGLDGQRAAALVAGSIGLLVTTTEVIDAEILTTRLNANGDIYTYRIPWTQEHQQ